MEIFERRCKRAGLTESLFLKCSKCKSITDFQTSQKVLTDTSKNKHRKVYDVNVRSVFASTTIGRKGLAKMCGLLDLPRPVGSKPYNKILKTLSEKAVGKCEIIMRNAAKKLTEITLCDNPDDIFVDDNHTLITKVAVTVDGTWQRRGHCSKIGVVFVISVITGEVLDYVVKSLVRHECIYHQNDNKESDQYKLWVLSHQEKCCINHAGSSDTMEKDGAKEIFLRSMETRGLSYVNFIGDC